MVDLEEMQSHANQNVRCEEREPLREGIDPRKMRLISSSWGVSWDKIYEILFPGAPIPSPRTCYITEHCRNQAESSQILTHSAT